VLTTFTGSSVTDNYEPNVKVHEMVVVTVSEVTTDLYFICYYPSKY